jgi:S-adenosylmethionine-diacylglycerol 3-amino-3-carboxypropyl transferase
LRIDQRAAFDFIRYANCWEDADILCEALKPAPGARVLSIASAGDNSLALLADGAEVVAADLSRPQLACLEIRTAAFKKLEHDSLLAFLGVRPSRDRLVTFDRLASDLSIEARAFWQARPGDVERGVIHAGRFEAYFGTFRRFVLPLVHSQKTLKRLLEPKDLDERRRFWHETWNNRRWRFLFHIFFSRFVMGRMGRDPEFFRYVEGSVSDRVLARAERALVDLSTHDNPFLDYIVHGNFTQALPRYLRLEHFDAIRSGLDRLTICHGPIEEAGRAHLGGGFDALNLSDIFEYLDGPHAGQLYGQLLDLARSGARLAYWNTLVPRSCPPEMHSRARPLRELAHSLFARDRAFFYCNFEVDEVV